MNIEAQKMRFKNIDNDFELLKKSIFNTKAKDDIKQNLEQIMVKQHFEIEISQNLTNGSESVFGMSVYPEESTIDKIIDSIVNEQPSSVIEELWRKNLYWTIEIDSKILTGDDDCTPRECTALLLHELGHVIDNNAIPSRIARVMKFEFAKMSSDLKAVFKSDKFKKLLSLAILDGCSSATDKDDLRREMTADKFAQKMGYGPELSSVLRKFIAKNNVMADKSMKDVTMFSVKMVENFKKRDAKLNYSLLSNLVTKIPSGYIRAKIQDIRYEYTEGSEETSITDSKYREMICESVNNIIDNYYTEFFFSKKKLKKLDPYDIDYIQVEIDKVKSHDDKLLILSYLQSKVYIAQYYIDILSNDNYSKKYEVPHTMEFLTAYIAKLNKLRDICINKKIDNRVGIYVNWPTGYEG